MSYFDCLNLSGTCIGRESASLFSVLATNCGPHVYVHVVYGIAAAVATAGMLRRMPSINDSQAATQ